MGFEDKTYYQIYIRSFQDSNGDGIGDLEGIRLRLPYLKELGVDTVWITPFFRSHQYDNGYDVDDYCSIDPIYGTFEDFDRLATDAKEAGIGLMLDMVFNHTSIHHEWFQNALAGDQDYQDYYIFKDPRPDGSAPTNWVSKFGGSTWEYVPHMNKYYLHLFHKNQPDLNWENPKVRAGLVEVLKFWKDRGVRGFRFDVVNLISKPEVFEDDGIGDGRRFYTDGPHVHEFLKEMVAESGIDEWVTVGEMSSTSIDSCVRYTNPDEGELDMTFSFHHLKVDYPDGQKWVLAPVDWQMLKDLFDDWQVGMQEGGGWSAWFWNNHDQPRSVSRLGDDQDYHYESATMLATLIHLLRGTPYIFQGEEFGMTNAHYETIEDFKDVESFNYYRILQEGGETPSQALHIVNERSRDNGRTPMQWDSSPMAGFTIGKPWIKINDNKKTINAVSDRMSQRSIFAYYQRLIALRKAHPVIAKGLFIPVATEDPQIYAYERRLGDRSLLVLLNFSGETKPHGVDPAIMEKYATGEVLIRNDELKDRITEELSPYEAVAILS